MKLRLPRINDANKMLATMSNPIINQFMTFSGKRFKLEEIIDFIEKANDVSNNLHLVIASETNEYLGSVSLKNIDFTKQRAEYSIVLSLESVGRGIATWSTNTLFSVGFNYLDLKNIYLSVDKLNHRAIRFYEKSNFISKEFDGLNLDSIYNENLRWFIVNPSIDYSISLLSNIDEGVFYFLDQIKEA
jgi:diamine N-acetyltransferase